MCGGPPDDRPLRRTQRRRVRAHARLQARAHRRDAPDRAPLRHLPRPHPQGPETHARGAGPDLRQGGPDPLHALRDPARELHARALAPAHRRGAHGPGDRARGAARRVRPPDRGHLRRHRRPAPGVGLRRPGPQGASRHRRARGREDPAPARAGDHGAGHLDHALARAPRDALHGRRPVPRPAVGRGRALAELPRGDGLPRGGAQPRGVPPQQRVVRLRRLSQALPVPVHPARRGHGLRRGHPDQRLGAASRRRLRPLRDWHQARGQLHEPDARRRVLPRRPAPR